MNNPTPIDILNEVMYNPDSPSGLSWKCFKKNRRKDLRAGSQDSRGYWFVSINYKTYSVHRLIWEICKGVIPDNLVINHIDNDPSNNLIENLEVCTQAQNCRRTKLHKIDDTCLYYHVINDFEYWRVQYTDLSGNIHRKYFSISKLGNKQAKLSAKLWRERAIIELNSLGAGYTLENNGTIRKA